MIEITHNFDPDRFMWLWAKYVTGFNEKHHCTNSIRGRYSKVFSKNNPEFRKTPALAMNEQPPGSFHTIYVCGVSKQGYSNRANYPHNVHAVIRPETESVDSWSFEHWTMLVRGGTFLRIPTDETELPDRYRGLPAEFTSCRIFRWSASFFDTSTANNLSTYPSPVRD
jgi:hypothetical protein